jgi:hypothetical protein
MIDQKKTPTTADDLVKAAIRVLQRGLPPGDLNDRQVISELWGIFDGPAAREIYNGGRHRQRRE